jgi:hypothetical protein
MKGEVYREVDGREAERLRGRKVDEVHRREADR